MPLAEGARVRNIGRLVERQFDGAPNDVIISSSCWPALPTSSEDSRPSVCARQAFALCRSHEHARLIREPLHEESLVSRVVGLFP